MSRTVLISIGVLLVAVGGYFLVSGGFTRSDTEQLVDIGPVEASAEVERRTDVPPLLSGLVLAAGAGLVVFGATRKA